MEDRAEESALAAIVRSSQDAVMAKTVDGVVTAWNAGAEQIFGFSAASIVGADIETTIPPEFREQERERHGRVAAGGSGSGTAACACAVTAPGSRW